MYDESIFSEELLKVDAGDTDAMREAAYYILYASEEEAIHPVIAETCISYLEKAVAAGNPDAMLDLGGLFIEGKYVPLDIEKGLSYYLMAAEAGFPYAYHRLASFYLYDEDTDDLGYLPMTEDPERKEIAFRYFLEGAEAGHGGCMNEIGVMCMLGEIDEKNPEQGFEWFSQALQSEYADPCDKARSAYYLAQCLHYGEGIEMNLDLAREYAQLSVDFEIEELESGRACTDYFLQQSQEELNKILADMQ